MPVCVSENPRRHGRLKAEFGDTIHMGCPTSDVLINEGMMLEGFRAAATEEQPRQGGAAQSAARPTTQAEFGAWTAIPASGLEPWNSTLRQTAARLYQYPFWNESLKALGFKTEYLVYERDGAALGYVALMVVGLGALRFGLVSDGPVNLRDDQPLSTESLATLRVWARHHGFAFLRFSHMDNRVLEAMEKAMGRTERLDSFPLYPPLEEELIVTLDGDENSILARFQKVARQEIRRAAEGGYEIRLATVAEAEASVRSLFEGLKQRKGEAVYHRPLASYLQLVRQAERHGCALLYIATRKEKPVQFTVVLRTRDMATYVLGAIDVGALEGETSPGCLVHWRAMRDALAMGVKEYNLGTYGWGGLRVFKGKFRPEHRVPPAPVTVVLRPVLWGPWKRMLPLISRHGNTIRDVAGWLLKALDRVRPGRSRTTRSEAKGNAQCS